MCFGSSKFIGILILVFQCSYLRLLCKMCWNTGFLWAVCSRIRTAFFIFFIFSPLISIRQLYNQSHYKYLQHLQDIWNLQILNTSYKVKLNCRDKKLEEDLKDLITRIWAWFVRIESTSFIMCFLSNKEESFLYTNWINWINLNWINEEYSYFRHCLLNTSVDL